MAPTPPPHFSGYNGNSTHQAETPSALTGLPAAVHVLGPQSEAPAIQHLLKTAPDVDIVQLKVVRDILNHQPSAADSYDILMQALFQTQANGGQVPQ
jgi:hypothetical protein